MAGKKAKARIGITKKMTFSEVLEKYPETSEIFMDEGMHCIGCPMSASETIEQGCEAHELNAEKIIEKLNNKLKNLKEGKK